MALDISAKVVDEVVVISVSGEALDASNVMRFKTEVSEYLESNPKVVFDFGRLRFIDSSGIGALLSCLRKVNASGGDIRIAELQPNVASLFELVRMNRLLQVFGSVDLAIRSF